PMMPSWFVNARPVPDAHAALNVLADAASQGLDPRDYRTQALAQAFEQARQGGVAPDTVTQLDAELTAALERYLSDLNHGRLSPAVLKHRFKAPPSDRFDANGYLLRARQTGRLAEALNAAQPRAPMYDAIRSAMNGYRNLGDHPAWQQSLPPLPGRSLKPGGTYAGLSLLGARLAALGDLASTVP